MGFQQGLSGLNVSSRNLEVIGNNVANSSTFGAKAGRAEFADMYANSLNGAGSNNVGIGATVVTVAQQFSQGNISTTENPLDLGINGPGFFQLSDGQNPNVFSRNGQFKLSREGFIVNNSGLKLLGYQADDQGTIIPAKATPLTLPTGGIEPNVTDKITLEMTFDSRVGQASGNQIDFAVPDTYSFATSQTVYDEKGQPAALTYYFRKTANPDAVTDPAAPASMWDMYVSANGKSMYEDASVSPAVPLKVASIVFPPSGGRPVSDINAVPPYGTITVFDDTGNVSQVSRDGIFQLPTIASVAMPSGEMTRAISGVSFDISKSTEYGSSFSVTDLAQTGYAPGQLTSIKIDSGGVVLARYSNGQSKAAGQIELANFRNTQGLDPQGGNVWQATYTSGDPIVGVPGVGNMGVLQAGALEESNVDLTGELVNMIVAQRMYQANAQTIKTEDQVLQTLVNLR